jgi:hypothetical protein
VAGFMKYQTFITAVALIALPFAVPFASAAKAYEVVNYKGKAAGLRIAFEFGYGYPHASEIKITESASGKTIKFLLAEGEQEGTGKMRFVPESHYRMPGRGDDGTKELLLEMEGDPPPTVKGTYTAGGKTGRFTLKKID